MRQLVVIFLIVLLSASAAGCTAVGFGLGWRADRAHNTRQITDGLAEVQQGERIRLRYDGRSVRGTLVSADSTGIVFQPEGESQTFVSIDRVQSVRYERGRTSGRVIGGLIGLGLDVIAIVTISNDFAFFPDTSPY